MVARATADTLAGALAGADRRGILSMASSKAATHAQGASAGTSAAAADGAAGASPSALPPTAIVDALAATGHTGSEPFVPTARSVFSTGAFAIVLAAALVPPLGVMLVHAKLRKPPAPEAAKAAAASPGPGPSKGDKGGTSGKASSSQHGVSGSGGVPVPLQRAKSSLHLAKLRLRSWLYRGDHDSAAGVIRAAKVVREERFQRMAEWVGVPSFMLLLLATVWSVQGYDAPLFGGGTAPGAEGDGGGGPADHSDGDVAGWDTRIVYAWLWHLFSAVLLAAPTAQHTLGLDARYSAVKRGIEAALAGIPVTVHPTVMMAERSPERSSDGDKAAPSASVGSVGKDKAAKASKGPPSDALALWKSAKKAFDAEQSLRSATDATTVHMDAVAAVLIAALMRGVAPTLSPGGTLGGLAAPSLGHVDPVSLVLGAHAMLAGFATYGFLSLLAGEYVDDLTRWRAFDTIATPQCGWRLPLDSTGNLRAWLSVRTFLRDFKGTYDFTRLQVAQGINVGALALVAAAVAYTQWAVPSASVQSVPLVACIDVISLAGLAYWSVNTGVEINEVRLGHTRMLALERVALAGADVEEPPLLGAVSDYLERTEASDVARILGVQLTAEFRSTVLGYVASVVLFLVTGAWE